MRIFLHTGLLALFFSINMPLQGIEQPSNIQNQETSLASKTQNIDLIEVSNERIKKKIDAWHKLFSKQHLKKDVFYILLGMIGGGLLGWLILTWFDSSNTENQKEQQLSEEERKDRRLRFEAELFRLNRKRHNTFKGLAQRALGRSVEWTIFSIAGGIMMKVLSSLWSGVKKKTGMLNCFDGSTLFKVTTQKMTYNAYQLGSSLTSFVKTCEDCKEDDNKSMKNLRFQMAYGIVIDHVALIHSFENWIGFVLEVSTSLEDSNKNNLMFLIQELCKLVNLFAQEEREVLFTLVNGQQHPEDRSLLQLTKGLYSELIASVHRIGRILYEEDFETQEQKEA